MSKRNKGVDAESFEQYLSEAQTWESDSNQQLRKSEKRAWWVAGAGALVGLLGIGATFMISMQEPPLPVVLRVDNATGATEKVDLLTDGKTNYQEVENKYNVTKYIRQREGYFHALREEQYHAVGLMSDRGEQEKYFEWFNPKNPQSPINVYGENAMVKINIKSISFLKSDVALVRYTKEVLREGVKPEYTHWAATMSFHYDGAPMKESDRQVSPLGFRVSEYRNDPDSARAVGGELAPQPVNSQPSGLGQQQ